MRFLHIRKENDIREMSIKGGITVAYEVDDDTVEIATARCSDRDNYCRKTGRSIAEGRFRAGKTRTLALAQAGVTPIEVILRNVGDQNV